MRSVQILCDIWSTTKTPSLLRDKICRGRWDKPLFGLKGCRCWYVILNVDYIFRAIGGASSVLRDLPSKEIQRERTWQSGMEKFKGKQGEVCINILVHCLQLIIATVDTWRLIIVIMDWACACLGWDSFKLGALAIGSCDRWMLDYFCLQVDHSVRYSRHPTRCSALADRG